MALNTCEASTLPDEQALPALTATPARSSPITKVSALVPGNRDAARVRQALDFPRQHHSLGHKPQSLRLKLIAKRGKLGGPLRFRRGELRRNAEADDAGDILSPRPPPPLLAAALDQGLDRGTLTEQESADSLWTADLVRRKRHHVGAKRAEFQRQPASDLNRIAMQKTAGGMNDSAASATGWIAPVSLLAAISETKALHPPRWCFASSFSSAARSITPSLETGIRVVLSR